MSEISFIHVRLSIKDSGRKTR